MMILDNITEAVLFFGSGYFMVPLAIIGFLYLDRKTFAFALFILLFTVCANPFLKMLWKMPLPSMGNAEGYGFPSGHLQSAIVFWGFLAFRYNNLSWRLVISAFLIAYAWALYIKGYHYPIDLLGAACFAALSLILYRLVLKTTMAQYSSGLVGAFLFMLASGLSIVFKELILTNHAVAPALGGLLGFSFGWVLTRWSEQIKFYESDNLTLLLPDWNMRARLLLISALGGGAIIYINFYLLLETVFSSPDLRQFCGFFMLSLWIAASPISVISYPNEGGK